MVDSISTSENNINSILSEKIRFLVENYGIDYLKGREFINALNDFQLFTNFPSYRNALFFMLENGLIERLLEIDYSLYKLEIDRFCIIYPVQKEIISFLAEVIGKALGKEVNNITKSDVNEVEYMSGSEIETNFFIPTNDGNFSPLMNIPENISYNGVAKILGHDTNQYFVFGGYHGKPTIFFEAFSGKILCVYVYNKTKSLNKSELQEVLKDYSFTEEYNYSNYYDDIQEGIKKGNLTKSFFGQLLNQDTDIMIDSRFNTKLFFQNEKLIKMESLDSLSIDAKSFRDTDPKIYQRIKKYAESFNFSQDLIFKEINLQIDAYKNIPLTLFNKFSEFYVEVNDENWSTNYVMCAIAYARKQINLDEFRLISHEEYSKIGEFKSKKGIDVIAYLYLGYVCFFNMKNGDFICCYKNGENLTEESNINSYYIGNI